MGEGKVLLGVVAGLAAGVALGVMFAPDEGGKTRKKMQKQGEDLAHSLNGTIDKKFEELKGSINEITKKIKTQKEALVSKEA
ncbi:YtxH domain-containing protein [Echinicola sp. CAU 1574]|uniref:YtxH domain-containing protein n=1 Tax=Echinicola arenosa TaxID=2774144 RepID=A0ABR9AR92_9BACT|nr:YtxH domain-containing protein [Echinicola arenosa]MBD8491306.1 YtxH domain-containing protein [Echinicola arenosa]